MTLPLLGQTMEEGTITKWLKSEGVAVEKGEPLLEVMTDKANMEVESPASGILRKIIAQEGAIVPVKDAIAIIGSAGESIDGLIAQPSGAAAGSKPAELPIEAPSVQQVSTVSAIETTGRVMASPRAKTAAREHGIDIAILAGKGTGVDGRIVEQDVVTFAREKHAPARATSLASKVAAEIGMDVASIAGSGPKGKVTRDDVLRAVTSKPARPSIARTIPLAGIRKLIAENISNSIRTSPHVTLVSEVDMTACVEMRTQLLPELEKRYGVRLTYTGIIVKAAALAILDHPIVNSSIAGENIVIHDDVNIGVAAAIEGGLVVPVVRTSDAKPLHEISKEIKTLSAKAKAGSLSMDEMQGGTFTVSNLATYGVDQFNPIINPPESAILGVCRIVDRPVVIDGKVQIRKMMNLCLSFDHRVMDGAPAGAYLARVKQLLESPYLMLV